MSERDVRYPKPHTLDAETGEQVRRLLNTGTVGPKRCVHCDRPVARKRDGILVHVHNGATYCYNGRGDKLQVEERQ